MREAEIAPAGVDATVVCAVGIDLVDVCEIEDALRRFGKRYLERVYTLHELDSWGPGTSGHRLAACFAAKEATLKALAPEESAVGWHSITVRRAPAGALEIELSGAGAELGARRGIGCLRGSFDIGRAHALAVVVGVKAASGVAATLDHTAAPTQRPLKFRRGRPSIEGMTDDIREILMVHARLAVDASHVSPHADLFEAGMSSHASISVMLALEEHFDIEFPDAMLKRQVFSSIASIEEAVTVIKAQVDA